MANFFQPVSKSNYSAAFHIQQSCHLTPWSESVFVDSLTHPYFVYQLLIDDIVVGYYVGLDVAGEATLMDIGVSKPRRGQGLGEQLLRHFLAQCKKRGCVEIWLEVRESNNHAVKLYENNGFNFVEIRKDYYPTETGRENGLIMKTSVVS